MQLLGLIQKNIYFLFFTLLQKFTTRHGVVK